MATGAIQELTLKTCCQGEADDLPVVLSWDTGKLGLYEDEACTTPVVPDDPLPEGMTGSWASRKTYAPTYPTPTVEDRWEVGFRTKKLWAKGLEISDAPSDVRLSLSSVGPKGAEDRANATVISIGVEGHRPGTVAPPAEPVVPESGEDDPLNLVAVANDDNDDGGPPGQKDDRDAAIGPGDDDVIQVTLEPPMPETMRGGVLRLTISPAEAVHVFDPTGTAFLADHSVVLAAPAGDLAALATGPVTIWLEGIAPCADVTVRLGYDPWPGLESAADAVHVTVSKVESVNVHGTDPETHKIPSVLGPNGNNHFVCARGTGDIVLAADISPDTPGLRDLIAWEAMGAAITCPGIGTDKRTARLASDASGRVPLTIKVAGCSAWEGTAWVVWAILNGNVAPAAWGPINSDAGLRIGTEVYAEYSCTATIEPASIIADPDRPDLAGPKAGGPPRREQRRR